MALDCHLPWFIKDMVLMTPDTLPFEQVRKALPNRNLIFLDDVVCSFGLSDDKLANLESWVISVPYASEITLVDLPVSPCR